MNKRLLLIVVGAAILVTLPVITAADDKDTEPALEDMKAKDLYKNLCKTCHMPDAEAGEYTPMSLIQEQWDEFFTEIFVETHKDVVCPKDKEKTVTDVVEGEVFKKLHEFCVDHAADSEQPMTCG